MDLIRYAWVSVLAAGRPALMYLLDARLLIPSTTPHQVYTVRMGESSSSPRRGKRSQIFMSSSIAEEDLVS